ncbi:hypothetical protein AAT19DRAFT_12884 [Rhodotorula toruloides]|uniref:Uncharacterized protein n=1 Tax=Rhodotorula toruloides TaxID=5286 RepID=A0A2T0ACX9_RHOTO|nr:hypothetical protein AAT19DRAFT_12884 [Rhodotorula toruloides]
MPFACLEDLLPLPLLMQAHRSYDDTDESDGDSEPPTPRTPPLLEAPGQASERMQGATAESEALFVPTAPPWKPAQRLKRSASTVLTLSLSRPLCVLSRFSLSNTSSTCPCSVVRPSCPSSTFSAPRKSRLRCVDHRLRLARVSSKSRCLIPAGGVCTGASKALAERACWDYIEQKQPDMTFCT